MTPTKTTWILLIFLGGFTQSLHAVLIFEKGKDTETRGYLVEETPVLVKIREVLPDGRVSARSIPRNEIDLMIQAVKDERLQQLDPQQPEGYRNYAEELAEKKKDPDAHITAIRLYLIAAYRAPDKLGRSSCLGLIPLARNRQEAQLFRGFAYLLDPNHDQRLLRRESTPVASRDATGDSTDGFDALLLGLRRLQAEDRRLALKEIQKPGVKQAMLPYRHIMLYEELFLICQQRSNNITNDDVRKILALEVSLLKARQSGGTPSAGQSTNSAPDWSTIVYTKTAHPIFTAALEHATEFDPRLCKYTDGKWGKILPDDEASETPE